MSSKQATGPNKPIHATRQKRRARDGQAFGVTGDVVLFDRKQIRGAIEAAVRKEAELSEGTVRDVAFHMTDWLDDLCDFYEFCKSPADFSTRETEEMLIRFLMHVPNHVAAASKLLTDIPVTDIFGVGATSESDDSEG